MPEATATLYFAFGNYIYGVRIPPSIAGRLDDFFSDLIDNNDIRVFYHGKGFEGTSERLGFWIDDPYYTVDEDGGE